MTYDELNRQMVGRAAQSRVLAKSTHAYRRGENIAINFHDTDILTFRPDGKVRLNADGWYLPVTLRRMNTFLPAPFHMSQSAGRWHVYAGDVDHRFHAHYFDGMVIDLNKPEKLASAGLSKDTVAKENKANRVIDAKIKKFLAFDVTPAKVVHALDNMGGDCFYCLMAVRAVTTDDTAAGTTIGDMEDNHHHLFEHMREHYVVGSMLRNAVVNARFVYPGAVLTSVYNDAKMSRVDDIHKYLTKYLRQRLRVGSTITKSKQTPQKAGRW